MEACPSDSERWKSGGMPCHILLLSYRHTTYVHTVLRLYLLRKEGDQARSAIHAAAGTNDFQWTRSGLYSTLGLRSAPYSLHTCTWRYGACGLYEKHADAVSFSTEYIAADNVGPYEREWSRSQSSHLLLCNSSILRGTVRSTDDCQLNKRMNGVGFAYR